MAIEEFLCIFIDRWCDGCFDGWMWGEGSFAPIDYDRTRVRVTCVKWFVVVCFRQLIRSRFFFSVLLCALSSVVGNVVVVLVSARFVNCAIASACCANQYAAIEAGVGYFCLLVLLDKLGIFIRGETWNGTKSNLNDFQAEMIVFDSNRLFSETGLSR